MTTSASLILNIFSNNFETGTFKHVNQLFLFPLEFEKLFSLCDTTMIQQALWNNNVCKGWCVCIWSLSFLRLEPCLLRVATMLLWLIGSLGRLPGGLSDLMLRLCHRFWLFVVFVLLWVLDITFVMAVSIFWACFLATVRYHLLVLAILISSSRCIPASPTPYYAPIQQPDQGVQLVQGPAYGLADHDHRFTYSRDELIAIQPARLDKDLIVHLRSLEIGTGLHCTT